MLAKVRTTCLPKYMERSAYLATFWKLGRYYRTYPEYVEDEVKAALDDPAAQFERGPRVLSARGTADDDSPAFVVEDGRHGPLARRRVSVFQGVPRQTRVIGSRRAGSPPRLRFVVSGRG